MCTYHTERVEVAGSGKGPKGWFPLRLATVYLDHPQHTPAEQGAGQVAGQPDDRDDLERQAVGRRVHDEGAVAVDGRVQRQAAGGQEGLAPARAVADHAHLAVGRVQEA